MHGLHAAGVGVKGPRTDPSEFGHLGSATLVAMNPTELRALRSPGFWFRDLRSIALIACVAGVLSLPVPMWNALQTIAVATQPKNGFWKAAGILAVVLMTLFTAIIPVFYFALYRDEAILYFPKRLRLLALIAAFTFAVIVLTTLPAWVKSLAAYFAALSALDWRIGATNVLVFVRDPRTIGQLSTLLGEVSNIACILMLIAIFRCANEPIEADVPVSGLLRVMARVAVVAWRLVFVVMLVRLAALPYVLFRLRNYALQVGRTPPTFGDILAIRESLLWPCLFAAPYIVYRSLRERADGANVQSGPELPGGGA